MVKKKQRVDSRDQFLKVLEEKKKLVWPEIEGYLNKLGEFEGKRKIPSEYASLLRFHKRIVSDYPRRKGKYIRPGLVLLTASAMGFPEKKAVRTAAAMQVCQDWILNHDDWEDDSLMRRGQPTLHRLYSSELAVNAGDALHNLMWRVLKDNEEVVGRKRSLAVMEEFYQMLSRTCLGQEVEIRWAQENKFNLSDQDIFFILEGKTAYYTIAGPMRLGAILAGGNETQLEFLYEFGQYLGRCFQIKDDLLDLVSDFKGLKKQTGNDIYEGKRTIMLAHLLREVKGKEKQRLLGILEKKRKEKSEKEVKWVIGLMKKHGSLEYGKKLAEESAVKAREIFEEKLGFLKHQPARDQLKTGIDFMLTREC